MSSGYRMAISLLEKDLEKLKNHNFSVYKCTVALFELARVDDTYIDIRLSGYLDKIARLFTLQNIGDCTDLFNFLFKYGVKGEVLLDLIENKYQKDVSRFRDAAWHLHSSVSIREFYDNGVIDRLIVMAPQRRNPDDVIKELQEII